MAAIADTGFLFALANTQDEHHHRVINVVRRLAEPVIVAPHCVARNLLLAR